MDFVKAAFDAGGQAVSFASASSSHSATCMQDAEIQPAVRPLPPAATKNASPQHSAGSPETCAVPSSLLFPGGSALSSSPVPSPEAAESSSSNTTGGTSNPFAFHSRSRLLTPRALLSHPPAFPSSFSAAAEGTNGDTKQTYDTSQRRVASFFRNEDKHTNSSSSWTPFNKGRCDNAGYSSLRLLLPPQPGGCSLSAGAPGQGHNPFDSSNSCMTASSCCTTDASSHSGTLLGSSSPILSFSMPATPRLPQFYSPGSHQPAAYAGLPPGSLSPIDATSDDAPCTTNTVLAGDWKDTKARLISSHLPSAVVSESSAAAAARAWPAKRRRSIQVDGSSNQSYMLPMEQLQQQVSYLNGRGTGEQQHPSALQQEQQQQNTGCTSRLDPAIEEETHHYISSNRVNSTNTPMTGTAAQQQQQQQKTQGTPGYPPVMMMTALSDDSKGYPMRPRAFSALAGGCSNIPHVIVSQPERLSGREKTGNPTREDNNNNNENNGNSGNNDNGTVNASWYSAEEVLKAQEDNADAGVRAVSDADATGDDNGNCSWASQTATGFLNDARRRSPVAACAAQGESADAEGATGGGQQRRWEFLDSGCYSVGYHTAMAVVPYSALSTESKAAQQLLEQQQALLLDREREARRRRKACLSVLRSVHNALSASPPRDKHTAVAARRSSSPGGVLPADTSSHSFLPFTYSLSTSRKNSLHRDEVAFTDGAAEASAQLRGGDTATATAHKQPLQGKEGGTGLCFFAADTSTSSASSSQDSSFPASKGGVVTYNIPVPRSTTAFGSSVQQPQMSTQQQQQQFFLSVLPHCQRDQQQQSATMTAADLDASGNSTAARSAASNRHTSAGFSLGAAAVRAGEDESRARSNPCISVPTCEKQAGAESVSLSSSGLLRLQPEWLSPYTLAALIGACVHCYDVIRAAYPAPEPPPRLCLISLPALYTQLPPHLLEGAVLLDESALNLGSPPQCLPIECSSISHPSGQNVAGGAGRRSSNNSSNGSDKGSWTNNGLSRGEEIGTRTLPGNLLGQFDIIVCETRSVTLATVENVAACVKALSRRRRRTRYSASGKKAARRYGGAYTQQVEGSIPSRLGGQGESPSMGRKEVHMQSTTSDNEDDEKEEEDKDSRLEKEEEEEIEEEEVDVAAAALGCLSLLKVGQSDGGATTPEKQLKEQQLQQQLQQQQETFQRLPSSVRVIMLSTCLLSAVIDDLLGLKQCRFQPYVPSSALSSLQLQCIYTNFEDYPLFQKHNDFDFTTRVRARRGGARFAKGPRRGGAIESMESCAGGHIHSRAGSSSRRETQAREPGGGDDTVLRDPLISRALALQAEQEARAAAHPGEIPGEATLAHSTTNDEFSSEKSAAEEEADDASDLLVGGQQEAAEGEPCQSCQRHRETTLMNAFEAFHLQASPRTAARTMSQQQELPLQSACVVPPPSHEIADKSTTTYAYSDPASCCQHNRRLSLGENCQRRGGETNSSLGQSQVITHSKAYHGITMRQGDDDEDDGIDYDLECGSHFGMVAHDL